ncbi:type IV toxin-antitoxin system AbiEi family antitoxin domain-containing protein [Phascolarctobacterium faecium]|uniref:type IV toxin-antitoxin system AbiEi family antitoxin domain-containing protein n=1 Tax=Phascolarctobacterium faecium TaxID=33025 RepID=UPI003A9447DE
MADKDIIKKLADECGGVFRTSDLAALGYNTYAIRKIVESQIIERIKQGYYLPPL